jgi:glycosyltransferase involved in cell wall biosynthesis
VTVSHVPSSPSPGGRRVASVTVCLPFHDGVKPGHLAEAIYSLGSQTAVPSAVHLLADGDLASMSSRHVAAEAVSLLSSRGSDVRTFSYRQTVGLPHLLNQSLAECRTRYWARMDADDIAAPDRFAKQAEWLDRHPFVGILGSWAYEFRSGSRPGIATLKKLPTDPETIREYLHYRNPLHHPTVMFRTEVFDQIGGYRLDLQGVEDLELWIRAAKSDVGIANLPEPLLLYRTDGRVERRRYWRAVVREFMVRISLGFGSPRLAVLKLAAVGFRCLPQWFQLWGYRNLRAGLEATESTPEELQSLWFSDSDTSSE